ncbi:MAG: Fic family protein [Sulfurospirillaceae bacterium]|nr:Fic family protein [Sulfurospirillaceae bacterium]
MIEELNSKKIAIPDPSWGSDLANIILDLEKLRTRHLSGNVPPYIFFQLKNIFQILETLGSARIEGNNTTLSEYVEKLIDTHIKDESDDEIKNLENAIRFIEENTDEETIFNRAYISQIHKIITKDLTPPPHGEGSKYPGELRKHDVSIKKSGHTPPQHFVLVEYFEKFVEFINAPYKEQYQLLMVAIAHHRFEHIHPFDNGNGRMGRLLNYAFLIKLGFKVKQGRLINPSSVFYTNRDQYYDMLSRADSLEASDLLAWCEYFLRGLKNEIEKIDHLLKKEYVQKEILLPTLKIALEREHITKQEFDILSYLIKKDDMAMKAEELSTFGITDSKKKSLVINKLRDKKMIAPITDGGRIYTVHFVNNYLLRGIMQVLKENGFVSDFLNNN